MAAAQLNHALVPNLASSEQHSVKAMLIQKHLNELEKFQQSGTIVVDGDIIVDSPGSSSDSNDENKQATNWIVQQQQQITLGHNSQPRSMKRTLSMDHHHDQESQENDTGPPYSKSPRLIDVESIESPADVSNSSSGQIEVSQQSQAQRNVFSIRNLIYSKDSSDSESAESEDSGNVNSSSSGGNSPNGQDHQMGPWRPDPEMLQRLKSRSKIILM